MLNELNAAVVKAMDTYCNGDEENLTVRVTSMAEDGPDLLWWLTIAYKGDCVSRWMVAAEGVRHSSLRTPGYGLPELHEEPATEGGEQVEKPARTLYVFTLGDSWLLAENYVCEQVEHESQDWSTVIADAQASTHCVIEGERYARIRYGDESADMGDNKTCGDCAVAKGQVHVIQRGGHCDMEECPACEVQALSCGHRQEVVEPVPVASLPTALPPAAQTGRVDSLQGIQVPDSWPPHL